MFRNANSFNSSIPPKFTGVTDMSNMFSNASSFNQNISSWDVSKATNMNEMFSGAESFNQNISSWDVSKVTNMTRMFHNASVFNQDIGFWNVKKVVDMTEMFHSASVFDQNLTRWNVCKLKNYANFSYNTISSWTDDEKPIFDGNCIVAVNSSNPDGKYVEGDNVSFELEYKEAVNVIGFPKLEVDLRLKTSNRYAVYVNGSGTKKLTFNYTVEQYDVSDDLNYVNEHSLSLNGGSITSVSDNKSALLNLPDEGLSEVKEIQIGHVFTSIWDTKHTYYHAWPENTIALPIRPHSGGSFIVFWGDGTNDTISSTSQLERIHRYPTGGVKRIDIFGNAELYLHERVHSREHFVRLTNITRWGAFKIKEFWTPIFPCQKF